MNATKATKSDKDKPPRIHCSCGAFLPNKWQKGQMPYDWYLITIYFCFCTKCGKRHQDI